MMRIVTLGLSVVFTQGISSGGKSTMYVDYLADGVKSRGFMAYNSGKCSKESKCPAVMIVQDWNGMNEYEMDRACMLADKGYVAFAADIYGVDTPKQTMKDWMAASGAHANNATKYMSKMHGALSKMMEYDFVDPKKMAALGYCFGGTGMVNLAMAGHKGFGGVEFPSGLLGVVSYHGGLSRGYLAAASGTRPKLLLHSGGEDDSNDNIIKLTKDLEAAQATFEISRYGPKVYHSFTEWSANTPGQAVYDALTDERSWAATSHFLKELFSTGVQPKGKPTTAIPSNLKVVEPEYLADGVTCKGYMIYDEKKCSSASKCPGVMIVQDWNGMNDYEKARARMIAEAGYVGFAADIYGVDTPKATMNDWMAASRAHSSDATKYMSKIHGGFTQMLTYDFVDASNLAALGYCFGGTGLVNLAMMGHTISADLVFPSGLKGVVSFHGGISSGYAPPKQGTRPKLLYIAGAADSTIPQVKIANMTTDLESVSAIYELTWYGSGVGHAFTDWDSNRAGNMYDARSDFRSWTDTMDFLNEIFTGAQVGSTKPTADQCPFPATSSSVGEVSSSVRLSSFHVIASSVGLASVIVALWM